jgi:hypothetical protein
MISAIQIEDRQLTQQIERFPQALRGAVERGLRRATELLRVAVSALAQSPLGAPTPGAFGEFADSVTSEVTDESGNPAGSVFLAPPTNRYGLFVELGTRPHFPPPAALEGWVRRRLGITGDREVREVAFLIGRKIARVGTPGQHFFERALRDNESRVLAVMEEEVAKAL